jgi:uncharacterized Zn-binding protein involved in type VI secretion
MPEVHRNTDDRACGAKTVVSGQTSVYVNGKLWAVKGDTNTHDAGGLINRFTGVYINGKPVIVRNDPGQVDGQLHAGSADKASGFSPDVFCYE